MSFLKNLFVVLIVIIMTSCTSEVEENDLSSEDFSFIYGDESVFLDEPIDNFTTKSAVIESEDNDLGEVEAGDYSYHFYFYDYEDFTIYASNALYDLKDRDVEELYISQLETVSEQVKTPRDIGLGSTFDEIVEAYGHGSIIEEEGYEEVFFDYYEKNLTFILTDDIVTGIRMLIDVNASEVAKTE